MTRVGAESYGAIRSGMACLRTRASHSGFTTILSHCSRKCLGQLVPWLSFSFSFFFYLKIQSMSMKSDLFSSICKLHSDVHPEAAPLLPSR